MPARTPRLILVGGVNAVLAVTMTAAMAATGFGVVDTAAMCLGVTGVSMVFGAVAAVTAQLWRQARTATGAAMGVLALAVLVRGIGDVINNSGSALSWFSPIAWAQQMRPFVDLRWWPFALLVVLAVGLMGLAAVLESRRQYDDGVIPSTGERPNARPIKSVFGLHVTLQRGQTIGWTVGLFLSGLTFGSMTKSLLDAAKENELLQRVLAQQGTDGVYTTMTQFLAAAATAYVVTAVLRVFNDEQSGLGEAVLAGAVSRWRWLLTAVAAAIVGSTVLMFFAGLGNGLGAGITIGEPQTIWRLTLAGLAFVPAMAVMAGIAALAVALRHTWIGWLAVTFVIISLYLGALLRLPQWLLDASPVGQTKAPTEYSAVALTVMVVAAAALSLVAGAIYRRRDAICNTKWRNHEDRSSNVGVHSLQHRVLRPAAVLARGHVRLLAGLGFHRRVRRRHHGPDHLSGRAYPDAFRRRTRSGSVRRDPNGAEAHQCRHHAGGCRRGSCQRP